MAHLRVVATMTRRWGWRVDRSVYRLTRGRFSLMGPDVMLLTTTGRRTGLPRETPVIYARDGDDLVISSEDFGQARSANWPLNLDRDPHATVLLRGTTREYTARRLDDADANRYWSRLVAACPAHATYWKRSGNRHVFVLTPAN